MRFDVSNMSPRRRRFVLVCATVVVVLVAAFGVMALRSSDDSASDDEHAVSTTTSTTQADTTSTAVPATTTTTLTAAEQAQIDFQLELQRQLVEDMPDDECKARAYTHLGITEPRTYPDGSFFDFNCQTGEWGWFHQGGPDDVWHANDTRLDESDICLGVPLSEHMCFRMVDLEESGVPTDLRHPAHLDALTLDEIEPGDTVCAHTPERPDHPATVRRLTITLIGTSVATLRGSEQDSSFPGFIHSENDEDPSPHRSLEDFGVIPTEDGLWRTAYVTGTPC